ATSSPWARVWPCSERSTRKPCVVPSRKRTVTGSAAAPAIAISTSSEADTARRDKVRGSDAATVDRLLSAQEPERSQARVCRHAVAVPTAQRVVRVEHRGELRRRAVHPGGGPVGDGLVHHLPRQHVLSSAHTLAHVEEPLEIDDALADALAPAAGHAPAGARAHHRGVGVADEEAEAALGREATHDERIAERGE